MVVMVDEVDDQVGVDEVGRGCLAGPLVTAAVLLDMEALGLREARALSALNDSKQHTHEAREALFPVVMRTAAKVAIVSRCAPGIDDRGLHRTNLDALRDALARVARPGCVCLVDGFAVPDVGHEQRAIVNGDATSAAIAATYSVELSLAQADDDELMSVMLSAQSSCVEAARVHLPIALFESARGG